MKIKKYLFGLFVAICSLAMISNVSAIVIKSYTSSLSLGAGKTLIGATRNYPFAGALKLSMKPNWIQNGSTTVVTELQRETSVSCILIATKDYNMNSTSTTYKKTFTNNSVAGDYFYAFSTKRGNTTYNGLTVPNGQVIMTLETASP